MRDFQIEKVTAKSPLRSSVQKLFLQSFPMNERVSLEPFFNPRGNGAELFALVREGRVEAFFCTLRRDAFFYLFYIAVDKNKRGLGIGSEIMSVVKEKANGATIFLDCEGVYPGCTHRAERVKRLCFYRKNGFRALPGLHEWRGEQFVTLVHGDREISEAEVKEFWEVFGGLWESEDVVGGLDEIGEK